MITSNKFCPCKYFTKAYLAIQYSSRVDLREDAAFYSSGGRGQSIVTFRLCFQNIASYSDTPLDLTNKIPALSSIFRTFPGPSLLFFRSFNVRSSVFHCNGASTVWTFERGSLEEINSKTEAGNLGASELGMSSGGSKNEQTLKGRHRGWEESRLGGTKELWHVMSRKRSI
jgi:hypothetical protein